MDKTIAKRDVLEIIAVIYSDNQKIVNYCQQEINRLNKKQEPKQDKILGDDLYCEVIKLLSNNNSKMLTAQDIVDLLKGKDLTLAQVRARLSQGVANGILQKEYINNTVYYQIIKGGV